MSYIYSPKINNRKANQWQESMKNKLLKEGISNIVYHLTTLQNAAKIINENRFILSPAFMSRVERKISNKKLFFMSTARSLTSDYFKIAESKDVILVLDGQKLSTKFKGKPVNYWDHIVSGHEKTPDEMEDRIFHNDQYINDAKKYIKEIHLFLIDTDMTWGLTPNDIKSLITLKKSKIPLFVYNDKRDFLNLNKKNNKKLKDYPNIQVIGKPCRNYERYTRKIKSNPYTLNNDIKDWIYLIAIPTRHYNNMADDVKEFIKDIIEHPNHYRDKFILNLSIEMEKPKTIKTITKLMKKYKLKTIHDIFDFIHDKWKEKIKQ